MKYEPPWREPYFIGVAGCSGSGKTSITSTLIQRLNVPWTVLLSMDNFYKPLTDEQRAQAFQSNFDLDSPDAIDFDLMVEVLHSLKEGAKTEIPVYSFKDHARTNQTIPLYGANVVIVEGIFALYDQRILDMLDLKVFVHEDYDVCMARRLHRDILYRGRQLELSILQWHRFVKPNYLAHILPTQKRADIVLPRGIENTVAINILFQHVQRQLLAKSQAHLEYLRQLGRDNAPAAFQDKVTVLQPSNQVAALHTFISDANVPRDTLVHSFNRIADLLITQALEVVLEGSDLPSKKVMTPQNVEYDGLDVNFGGLCAVTMIRGGECFEYALKASIPTIFIGRLLIQSDNATGEPKLHTSRLPPCLVKRLPVKVLLTEAQLLSGAAAVMALAVLVDHGVSQEDIVLITYSASEIAIRRVNAAFPAVRMVIGRLEPQIAMLDLDSRYYGT